jgi:CubicO group peptidase (beta-lactamase class C family)
VFRLGASQLGPGPGEWLVEDPRVHGLSSAKLASAAERHARELDQRDCLLVVKDGVIVHETYREGGDADTLHYLDGVGRAAAALLIGAAEHQGVLDLDTPLSEYGIAAPPVREYGTHGSEAPAASGVDAEALAAHPELRWGDEWSRVTARHVLGQATGLGEARAGETFDARVTDEILDVLSQVLRATTGMKPAEWAKEHFTGPLGVPDFFARDVGADGVADGGVRVAGGQMATCRDAARFGQLLINRGEWLGEDGSSTRLVRADFVRRVVNPSFPRAASQRGYQTWTHPGKTASGAPRATPFFAEVREATDEDAAGEAILGAGKTTTAATPTRAPVWADYETSDATPACGDDFAKKSRGAFLGPAGPSFPLAFAVGELGKFLVVSPETGVVVVSMGNTWGSEREQCPSGLRELLDGAERARRSAGALAAARLGLAPGKTVGYDASVLMRQLWHAVGDAVTPVALLENGGRKTSRLERVADWREARRRDLQKGARRSEPPRRRRRRRRARGRRRLRARKGVGEARRRGGRKRHARGGGLRGEAPGRLRGARGGGKTRSFRPARAPFQRREGRARRRAEARRVRRGARAAGGAAGGGDGCGGGGARAPARRGRVGAAGR